MSAPNRSWVKRALANLSLFLGSLLVFALVCEFLVFRFILKPSDFEANFYKNDVVRYAPNQTGTYRLMDEIESPFSINADGWNSRRDHYERARQDGIRRIAIVGDSYVHAREVPFDQSFSEMLEDRMNTIGNGTEVFRFGIKGAPLSQYLQMIRREVISYHPDVIIVILIHNDFDESFNWRSGRYIRSFLHLEIQNGKVIKEVPPEPYEPNIIDWLSQSATLGYLVHRQQINIGLSYVSQLIFGGSRSGNDFEANIDIAKTMTLMDDIAGAMDYVFGAFADIVTATKIPIVLVMDGHRDGIYDGRALEPGSTRTLQLNSLAAATADRYGLPFLDLHPAFLADWQAHGRRFNFQNDGHWNLYGHELVAREIEKFLTSHGLVEGRERRTAN